MLNESYLNDVYFRFLDPVSAYVFNCRSFVNDMIQLKVPNFVQQLYRILGQQGPLDLYIFLY